MTGDFEHDFDLSRPVPFWKVLRHLWRSIRAGEPLRFVDDADTYMELNEMHKAELERLRIALRERDLDGLMASMYQLQVIELALLMQEKKMFA